MTFYEQLQAKGWRENAAGEWCAPGRFVGAVVPEVTKPITRSERVEPGSPGVVVCVEFIACRRRILDDDNNVASFKVLRDCVAATLGVPDPDDDPRIEWRYHQLRTRGAEGVIVKIEKGDTCVRSETVRHRQI